jgi:pyruvate/2-oxoglutarate/acetoin dehydrogenase E1 component
MRDLKYKDAILEATKEIMAENPSVYFMGQGATSPKAIYGTVKGLQKQFGASRVMDMPFSENGITGVAIGSALAGMRPILCFHRVDFFLRALDQLINNAAKWNYMSAGQLTVPLVIRLIMGRGWGQGPQHSQSLQSLFAHIPGLKVVMPATAADAKGLMHAAMQDNNPVIFMEHRWLHNTYGPVPDEPTFIPLGKAKVIREGTDVTIITSSYMTLEALKASHMLEKEQISAEIIDLRSIKPLDKETLIKSVRRTGRVVVTDCDWKTCGFAAEVLAILSEEAFYDLKAPPIRITYPDRNNPTSWSLSNHYYPTEKVIALEVLRMMNRPSKAQYLLEELLEYRNDGPLDVPDPSLEGPF